MGRIHQEKGLDLWLRRLLGSPRTLCFCWLAADLYREELESVIRRLQVQERVSWLPWVPSDEVVEYMNRLDVLALPFLHAATGRSNLAEALIEAMACETCVVGSDSGEIPNVIGDPTLVFHEGNEQELADGLRGLMDDPARRVALGRLGRGAAFSSTSHTLRSPVIGEKFTGPIGSRVGEMNALAV